MKFASTDATLRRWLNLLIMSGMILSILWINVAWISSVYGQTAFPQFPGGTPSNTSRAEVTTKPSAIQPSPSSSSSSEKSQLSSSAIKHGVRITLPVRDQKVPAGAILTISGISKDNATSDCNVNVNVNHVRPYQNTSATGPGGPNDYSNWTFSLTPKYTVIKQGPNEITAKFFCNPNPEVASFYSMNVTGVPAAESKIASPTSTTNSSNTTTTATVTNQT